MKTKSSKKRFEPETRIIKVSELSRSLLNEINTQVQPLFDLWSDISKPELLVTFNSVRIITPILEMTSIIDFNGSKPRLLEKLNIPEPQISWDIFRNGLSHGIRPFYVVKINGLKYTWGIKNYKGAHYLSKNNEIIISTYKLLDDLSSYLNNFIYSDREVEIQVGMRYLK